MTDTPLIALVATLHDPESRLRELVSPHVDGWLARFREVVIFTSPEGSGTTGALLAERGARVVVDEGPQGVDRLGRVRLDALRAAAARAHPYYFLVDLDRMIHWQQTYPGELRRVEQAIPAFDFFVLGRTRRAFESHPHVQREAERVANAAFAASFGDPLDVTGGQRGLSLAAVEALRRHSRCETLGMDGEWPVLCRRLRLRLGYFRAEGLEYETADRYGPEIAALGYDAWLDRYVNTPQNWEMRLRLAHQLAVATREAVARPLEI